MNKSERFVSKLTKKTLALIMAGGRGSRLKDLTAWRAKPSVPFGGKFRIIDFPLSNCINSDIKQIGVLTQYKAHSLIVHVQRGWGHLRAEYGEFVELLPAQQRINETSWYLGTADSIYQNLDILNMHDPDYVLILAGDHIYKMDYGPMLAQHAATNADITVGCIEVPVEEAKAFGVMGVDGNQKILSFLEKPDNPPLMPGSEDSALCSMGIYIFNKQFLYDKLVADAADENSSHDFGKDIIPSSIDTHRVFAYPFMDAETGAQSYWRDVGTVDAFWEANLELVSVTPELNLYDNDWPIWTYQEQLPPAKFVFNDKGCMGAATDSMVSGGCIISGARITNSLIFSNVVVGESSVLESSVILPEVKIGKNCQITKAVLDKGCVIPDDTVIGQDLVADKEKYTVSEKGVVLVTPDMLGSPVHHVT